ncbi:MAG: Unknown protein [uncultured Thiotrichaceae bacterium]|uniref:Uncharacterized protein n=1 Tax=uncultured Thiotrichaceae bacterium TaxID=298394 RepID=A0A6S6TAE6_9GAMM|nr:MAG: Unknown protein [uncultured Thiotrichaceae bacterium]
MNKDMAQPSSYPTLLNDTLNFLGDVIGVSSRSVCGNTALIKFQNAILTSILINPILS